MNTTTGKSKLKFKEIFRESDVTDISVVSVKNRQVISFSVGKNYITGDHIQQLQEDYKIESIFGIGYRANFDDYAILRVGLSSKDGKTDFDALLRAEEETKVTPA